jgi:hypothetical protein
LTPSTLTCNLYPVISACSLIRSCDVFFIFNEQDSFFLGHLEPRYFSGFAYSSSLFKFFHYKFILKV